MGSPPSLQGTKLSCMPNIVKMKNTMNRRKPKVRTNLGIGRWGEYFESNLRKILTAIKETMGAKLVMIEPFLLYGSDKVNMLEELDEKIRIERKLAQEYADAYLPMQAIFASETIHTPYTEFSGDGVHPNAGGAGFIAQHLLNTIEPIIAQL